MSYKPNMLRKLAKQFSWQMLYSRAKEMSGIRLFKNETDFSSLQTQFLYWLEVYNSLETELALGEENISRQIIDDEIRCDAYLLWKSKQKKQEQTQPSKKQVRDKDNSTGIPSVIFKGTQHGRNK